MAESSNDLRISSLETAVRRLQASSSTTTTSTSTSSGGSLTWVTETSVSLTKDATWRTATATGVPSSATSLLMLFIIARTSTVDPAETIQIRRGTYTMTATSVKTDLGSNITNLGIQVIIPSTGASFEYNIGNDASWTVTASIQGYFS